MRILITGAKGMLGQDLEQVLRAKHKLILADIDVSETSNPSFISMDVSDYVRCQEIITQSRPDIIINSAACTQVDKCEEESELAYRVNAMGPRNLAIISNQLDIPILHLSTDYVFDGRKKIGYLEDDLKNPLNIYGKSKSLGEGYVIQLTNKFYLVRTSWLFGANGNNFIKTMLRLGKIGQRLTVVDDQIGSPTYSRDLAEAIALLIEKPAYGIYHITNSDSTSWFGYAKYIFSLVGYQVDVKAVTSQQYKQPATRPSHSILENRVWQLEGFAPLRSYREAVREYIGNIAEESF